MVEISARLWGFACSAWHWTLMGGLGYCAIFVNNPVVLFYALLVSILVVALQAVFKRCILTNCEAANADLYPNIVQLWQLVLKQDLTNLPPSVSEYIIPFVVTWCVMLIIGAKLGVILWSTWYLGKPPMLYLTSLPKSSKVRQLFVGGGGTHS